MTVSQPLIVSSKIEASPYENNYSPDFRTHAVQALLQSGRLPLWDVVT